MKPNPIAMRRRQMHGLAQGIAAAVLAVVATGMLISAVSSNWIALAFPVALLLLGIVLVYRAAATLVPPELPSTPAPDSSWAWPRLADETAAGWALGIVAVLASLTALALSLRGIRFDLVWPLDAASVIGGIVATYFLDSPKGRSLAFRRPRAEIVALVAVLLVAALNSTSYVDTAAVNGESRLIPVLGGLVAVCATYLLARELFGWRTGLVAGALLAIHPEMTAATGQPAAQTIWAVGLSALTFYFLLKALRHGRYLDYGFAGTCLAFGWWLAADGYELGVIVALVVLHRIVFQRLSFLRASLVGLAVTVIAALLIVSSLTALATSRPGQPPSTTGHLAGHLPSEVSSSPSVPARPTALADQGGAAPRGLPDQRARDSIRDQVTAGLLILGLVICVRFWRQPRYALPILWLIVAAGTEAASGASPPGLLSASEPIVAILAAIPVGLLWTRFADLRLGEISVPARQFGLSTVSVGAVATLGLLVWVSAAIAAQNPALPASVNASGSATQASPVSSAAPAPGPLPASKLVARAVIGSPGTGPGKLADPRGVAVDAQGDVDVVDTGNQRIDQFSASGELIRTIGQAGSGPGQFQEPVAAVITPQGELVVLDSANGWISRFSSSGQFLGRFAGPSAGFYHPRGIAIDAAGNYYVADTGTSQIREFNPAGSQIRKLSGPATGNGLKPFQPVGIAVTTDGAIYATDAGNFLMLRYDSSFTLDGSWRLPSFDSVHGSHVAVAPTGDVYVTDPANHRVIHYGPDGKPLDQIGTAGQLQTPVGIAVDAKGNVYVADAGNGRVFVYGK